MILAFSFVVGVVGGGVAAVS